ncbi:hypothetical protein OAD67_02340 [bacterium]|nr:hypothetical protein [bacterium]MDC1215261.1 hypothetical protein [bacterium]|tara:strand:+ start:6034 stop:6351 length:318 start_codon:yes stop_codon:yes gene_type:complete
MQRPCRAGPDSHLNLPDDKNLPPVTREATSRVAADEDVPRPDVDRHSRRCAITAAVVTGTAPRPEGPPRRPEELDGTPAPAIRDIVDDGARWLCISIALFYLLVS